MGTFTVRCLALVFTLACTCRPSSCSSTYYVNGPSGWKNYDIATHQVPNYDQWASSQQIYPGDLIVFEYWPFFHDVHQFPDRAAYATCNFSSAAQLDPGLSGSFTWRPSNVGVYYFGCGHPIEGFGTHCTGGQKVAVTVLSPPSSSDRTNQPQTPPPPKNDN